MANIFPPTHKQRRVGNMTMNFSTTKELVDHLELQEHIEGGYFRETYRSTNIVKTARGDRNEMTNIYYCLPSEDFSVWHKLIDLEETFHYHWGDSAVIYTIENGNVKEQILGPKELGSPTIVMPPNTWFAIRPSGLRKPAPYILMSCSVVPGFEYEDLVIGGKEILDGLDPQDRKLAMSLIKNI